METGNQGHDAKQTTPRKGNALPVSYEQFGLTQSEADTFEKQAVELEKFMQEARDLAKSKRKQEREEKMGKITISGNEQDGFEVRGAYSNEDFRRDLEALWKSRRETEGTDRLGCVYVDDEVLRRVCGKDTQSLERIAPNRDSRWLDQLDREDKNEHQD